MVIRNGVSENPPFREKEPFLMGLRKLVLLLLLTVLPSVAIPSFANGRPSHTHAAKRSPDGTPKSVHVKSYTKKNGEHVKAYNRRPPKSPK